MIASGESSGWFVAGFFGLCLLVLILEPWLPKPQVSCNYKLLITAGEIACEHPKRKRESIRWEEVNRIWYVTTSDGPRFPDEWILLEGDQEGCSFPTEVANIDAFWDELEKRFPGFDYGPVIRGGTDYAKHLCWERQRPTIAGED
ncbi:MAG TPA: hypothetical protein VGK94_05410 [Candidatus Polarisedimenticolia bacterium]